MSRYTDLTHFLQIVTTLDTEDVQELFSEVIESKRIFIQRGVQPSLIIIHPHWIEKISEYVGFEFTVNHVIEPTAPCKIFTDGYIERRVFIMQAEHPYPGVRVEGLMMGYDRPTFQHNY